MPLGFNVTKSFTLKCFDIFLKLIQELPFCLVYQRLPGIVFSFFAGFVLTSLVADIFLTALSFFAAALFFAATLLLFSAMFFLFFVITIENITVAIVGGGRRIILIIHSRSFLSGHNVVVFFFIGAIRLQINTSFFT